MKKLFFATFVLLSLTYFTQTACYYDNEVEQYGVTVCDTTALSYNLHIKPIIDANCTTCHIAGGQQSFSPLDTYEGLNQYTLNRDIVNRVKGDGVALMPPAGALSKCDQQKIEAWVNAGAPNN